MPLRNSLEILAYCEGREDAKAGLASCANGLEGRRRELYMDGYHDGKLAAARRAIRHVLTTPLILRRVA